MSWLKRLLAAAFIAAMGIAPSVSLADEVTLWEDPDTGLVYTKPAEGRRHLEVETPRNVAEKAPWYEMFKFKGDLRLRYDAMDREGAKGHPRHRGRYRARLFIDANVTKQFTAHFQLSSGGSDPRSGNQSFTDSSAAPDLRLREAYVDYAPFSWLLLRGGQMANVLWRPTDGIWDKDISPQGGGFSVNYENASMFDPFVNAGIYVIDEVSGDSKDPFMWVVQPGVKVALTDDISFKAAGAYYGTDGVEGELLDNSAGSNTLVPATGGGRGLRYDYDVLVASGQIDFNEMVPYVPYVGLVGEYAYNPDPDTLNDGYIVGVAFGDNKLKEPGDWQAKYNWRRMGKDAILDILPDSDAYEGATNITGHEAAFKYRLYKNVDLGLDYYRLEDITNNIPEDRLQVDLVFSFPG